MNIPKTIAIIDALCDALPASEITDKIRGSVHFMRHADDALISQKDKDDAQKLHDVLLSDILEIFAKRGIPVK